LPDITDDFYCLKKIMTIRVFIINNCVFCADTGADSEQQKLRKNLELCTFTNILAIRQKYDAQPIM
jgi:hypothetical protein